jgi:pilus assembly protein Flp/PilA
MRKAGWRTRPVAVRPSLPPNPLRGALKMSAMTKRLIRFLKTEDGPTAVEYAVMLALLIVVCLTAIGTLGTQTNTNFSITGAKLKLASS